MDIAVFGATGTIGQRIVAEALGRGHRVTGVTRDASRIPAVAAVGVGVGVATGGGGLGPGVAADPASVTWVVADVLDPADVTRVVAGQDVVVSAINAGWTVEETIARADVFPRSARVMLTALERHPATRLLVIGGAGSLEVEPGLELVDTEGFAESLPALLGVPVEYVQPVRAHREALNICRLSNREWTYLSPSAGLIVSGERTGRYRVGTNQLLTTADGMTSISAEDLAVAVLDEVEIPRYVQRRFTVGY